MALSCIFGCSVGLKNISPDYQMSHQTGVVVFSLTSSGECGYAYFVDVRSVDKKIKHTIGLQDAFEERDWQREPGECTLDNMTGKLVTIELPSGNYIMYKFSGIHRIQAFESKDDFFISFKVTPHSVTYIGNIHFYLEKKFLDFKFEDKKERDLELLFKKYPNLKEEDLIIDILDPVEYKGA